MTVFASLAIALGLAAAAWLTHPLWWRQAAPSRGLAAGVGIFLFAVAGAGYAWLGAPEHIKARPQTPIALTLDQMATVAQRKLTMSPDDPKALALAGAVAFERKDYAAAVRHWETLERLTPSNSALAPQIQNVLAQARRLAEGAQ